MAQLAAAERVRAQVEGALTANQVNLASPTGREQAEALIEEALTAYQANALTTNGDGSPEQLEQIRRELRDDLLGLGQLAERMLADEDAQEWMVNGPRRIFKDTGERIERVTDIALPDDRAALRILERLLEHV
jgi:Flp pilus assembly CpaF family ATPase